MAEEEKKQEPEVKEEATVEIDGKTIPLSEVTQYYANKKRFETDYHETKRQLHETITQLEALKQEQEKASEAKPKRHLPDPTDDTFLDKLVATIEDLYSRVEHTQTESKSEIQQANQNLLLAFAQEHGLKEEELRDVAEEAIRSRHNKVKFDGQVVEISPKALENALLIVRKDQIIAKSKEEGKEALLKDIFRPTKKDVVAEKVDAENPNLKWIADNWEKLTDEQREKFRPMIYGRK